VVGELSLEGRTRPAKGVLSMAIAAARNGGLRGIVVPDSNAAEAAVVEELEVIPVSSLAEAAAFFAGHVDIDPTPSRLQELFNTLSRYDDDTRRSALDSTHAKSSSFSMAAECRVGRRSCARSSP
jgi:magnesium chelatase family protein